MPRCFVLGCPTKQVVGKQTGDTAMHAFPSCPKRIKVWLESTGQPIDDMDALVVRIIQTKKNAGYRMCSKHFIDEDYRIIGTRKCLKKDAIPTIFSTRPTQNIGLSTDSSTSLAQGPQKKKRVWSHKTRHTDTKSLYKTRSIGTWTGLISDLFQELSAEMGQMSNGHGE